MREVFFLKKNFGHRFHILHWCINQSMSNALAQMDLTASQGRIMGFISKQSQPPCPRDLEEAFHLSHPTVSGLLSRLEKKGFLELRPDPQDRRCKRIYMMPKAQECFALMDQTILDNEQRLIKDFAPEEQALFLNLLDRAIHNMAGGSCHSSPEEEIENHD